MTQEIEQRLEVFPLLLLLGHRLEYIADCELKKDGLTTKQFLAVGAIGNLFKSPPSISELANALSTTHQNVKQIALQLEKKGFIKIEKDEEDRRTWRLKLTEKNKDYWESRAPKHQQIVRSMFAALTNDQIETFYGLVSKLLASTDRMYRSSRNRPPNATKRRRQR